MSWNWKHKTKVFVTLVFLVGSSSLWGDSYTQLPLFLENPSLALQQRLYNKIKILVSELKANPLVDPEVKGLLSKCEFYMLDSNENLLDDFGDSRCLILISSKTLTDSFLTLAQANVFFVDSDYWVTFAVFYPYKISDESLLRIIYHEAIHMVDFMKNPECQKSLIACRIDNEFHANYKTLVLFQDYMLKSGFNLEQLSNVNTESVDDPVIKFVMKSSVSEIDQKILMQDVRYLKLKLNGSLFEYLNRFYRWNFREK